MKREWTKIGETAKFDRAIISAALDAMEWKPVGSGIREGAMPALGIKGFCEGFHIHPVAYAISNELAPYGLLAVETAKGQRIYVLDGGDSLTPLAIDSPLA